MIELRIYNKKIVTTLLIFTLLVLSSTMAFGQNKVSGLVVDQSGEALTGVSVVEKGTTNGTITDIDGKFSLNASPKSTLQFSFIGLVTQEIQATGTAITVTMHENDNILDGVVVIGYGKIARKDLTSSITTIKPDQFNKGGVYTSPGQLLQGKVPGLTITTSSNPTSTPSATLRGASSFRGGEAQEPYYVIDGIPGASIALIAPDNIESIDVLRDASATAIYGAKAANGVIQITTKRGKKGVSDVIYSTYLSIDQVSKRWKLLNASEHRKLLSDNGIPLSSNNYINDDTDTNWQNEVQRTGISHNHNLSITGGSENTNYSASLNYLENKGVIKESELDRMVARMVLNTKTLGNRLDLGFSLNASITNQYFAKNLMR